MLRGPVIFLTASATCGLLLAGCGGAGPASSPPTAPTAPTQAFSLTFAPTAVFVPPGGSQRLEVSLQTSGGFSGSVTVSAGAPSAGVTISPASFTLGGTPQFVTVTAPSSSPTGSQSVSWTATAANITVTQALAITISSQLLADPFHFVGGALVHGFYDPVRSLLFATNFELNELDVFSGQTLALLHRIPMPQPWGIDQMPDGNTLVIGTKAQEILTVNEDTFAVTAHPYTAEANYMSVFFPDVAAMANGKVLVIAQEEGTVSSNIFDGGQALLEWNSQTGAFSQLEPSAATQNPASWEADSLARSANHEWAVFSADQFYLYSSATDSVQTVPVSVVNPPDDTFGVRGYALNADGSEIAVASSTEVSFFDRTFNLLGTTVIPSSFQFGRPVQFSADGSRLYVEYDLPLTFEEVDTANYTLVGYRSGDVMPGGDDLQGLLAIAPQGRAFVGIDGGLRVVNLAATPVPNPASGYRGMPPGCLPLSAALPLNESQTQPAYNNDYAGERVYVGQQPAPLQGSGEQYSVTIPASAVAGPADVECVDQYGDSEVVADGVSYGDSPIGFSADWLPSGGGTSAYLYGFGFYASSLLGNETAPLFSGSVAIAGEPVINPLVAGSAWFPTTLEALAFRTPAEFPSGPQGVTVSGALGSGSLPAAARFYASPTVVPDSGILQLLYDPHRNVIYALKSSEIDVLDPVTLQWQSPIKFPVIPPGALGMALSPDGSKLVVAGGGLALPTEVLIFDPGGATAPTVVPDVGSNMSGSVAITGGNIAVLGGPVTLALNLSTMAVSKLVGISGPAGPDLVEASADGSHVYGLVPNVTSGTTYSIDPSTLTLTEHASFGQLFFSDLAVSPDGSQYAGVYSSPGADGDADGFFDSSLHYLNANVYPQLAPPDAPAILGSIYSPGGRVLVVPLEDSLEVWDATTGDLRAHFLLPETLQWATGAASPSLAVDPTGNTVYAASAVGVVVISLPDPLDQIPAESWPSSYLPEASASSYGPIATRMAAMRRATKHRAKPR